MTNWYELATHPETLADLDVAWVNLICAAGLPGTDRMDPLCCMRRIDELTRIVAFETARSMHQFYRNPANYENSEAYFRILSMITTLCRDCGIIYNPARFEDDAPFETEDSFIFGVFQGDGGTCASLPVVFTSIGRRLGYPLKLVSTVKHCFCHWDDPNGERFNIEGTQNGFSCSPDKYYRKWKHAPPPGVEERAGMLLSFTVEREFACFLRERAIYWWKSGHTRNAVHCMAWAAEFDGFPFMLGALEYSLIKWSEELQKRMPYPVPWPRISTPPRTFRLIPLELEVNLIILGIADDLLRRHYSGEDRTFRFSKRPKFVDLLNPIGLFEIEEPMEFRDDYDRW